MCQFLAAFSQIYAVLQSPSFIKKFLNKFFLLQNFYNVQIFH